MRKVSQHGVFSGPYSVRIQENTDQKKLRIWTLLSSGHANFLIPVYSDDVVLEKAIIIQADQENSREGMKDVWTRAITNLRSTHGFSFTAGKTKNEAGLHHVALRTVRNYVNKSGYYFRQLRRKGQVTAKDRKKQIIYAKEKLMWTSDFWLKYVFFLCVCLFCPQVISNG